MKIRSAPRALAAGLLIAQILLFIAAFYGLSFIGRVDIGVDLATPSCPQGIESIYMPDEQQRQCWEERLTLYLPEWIVPFTQIAVVGSVLCVLLGGALWALGEPQDGADYVKLWPVFRLQLVALGIALLLHASLIYPANLAELVEFTLQGTRYVMPGP